MARRNDPRPRAEAKGPQTRAAEDSVQIREPPVGSELETIERAATRSIGEMESDGAAPLGMIRSLHDNGWEDMWFVYDRDIQFGLMFDPRGYALSMYLTEGNRRPGLPSAEPAPASELETFQRALLRCAREAADADRQEFGVRYARIGGIEGLEVHNPDIGASACFAFDRVGVLWGLWHGWATDRNEAWLEKTIPRLKREGRI